MSQIPEPWASALVRAGFTDPRYSDDRPSLGALAEAAGVHTTTVSRMVHGRGKPKHENVEAVAAALRVDVVKVSEWVRQARTEVEPYRMPAEVNLLTRREQAAITELIRAMAEARREGEGSGDAAPNTPAGARPALADPIDDAGFESPDPPPAGGASPRGRRGRGQEGRA